jgi:DNA invertase Pin-like site-specific DNA recombinase
MTNYIGYARVSTEGQGRSGLGLEAQETTIRAHLRDGDTLLQPIMVEVESGRRDARPVLAAALARCRLVGGTLLVAKLDRLARNRAFVGTIMASGVPVEFCDVPASKGATGAFILGIMAEVAQLEAGLISERTRAALQAAKARGVKLGGYRGKSVDGRLGAAAGAAKADAFAARVLPVATAMRQAGMSLDTIARNLTEQGIVTPRGGAWTATGVRRILGRLA